jgi:hypothetical protein
MPQFVPVVDDETPRHERGGSVSAVPKKTVDRGWQQGTLGWGVQGNFGSHSKDEAAQEVVHRAKETDAKMVKNEKGLWVKVKHTDGGKSTGRGRGGGIPVFETSKRESNPKLGGGIVYDADDYVSVSKKRASQESTDSHIGRQDDRRHGHATSSSSSRRDDGRSRNERRRPRSCSRSRSRSGSGSRGGRGNGSGRSRDRSGRDRDRDRDRDRHRSRSRSRSRDRHRDRRRRSRSYSRSSYRPHSRDSSRQRRSRDRSRSRSNSRSRSGEGAARGPVDKQEGAEIVFAFTATQIVNRFLEVFASSDSANRIASIAELFSINAVIASLKNGNVLIEGQRAICASFESALPRTATVSKRVYVEAPAAVTSTHRKEVSFCLDLHRAGLSPGLGHQSKDTALLYRCSGNLITHVYGMIDKEGLAASSVLSASSMFKSDAWKYAVDCILRDIPSVDRTGNSPAIHFHDYDNMDVWG